MDAGAEATANFGGHPIGGVGIGRHDLDGFQAGSAAEIAGIPQRGHEVAHVELPHAHLEDAGHGHFRRQADLVLVHEGRRRIDGQRVADADAEAAGQIAADHHRPVGHGKLAGHETPGDFADARLALRIHAADQRGFDLPVGLLDEHEALQERRGADDARHGFDLLAETLFLLREAAGNGDRHVGIEVEDLLPPHFVEAGHHRQHDDQHRHAQQHSERREHGHHREERALWPEVLQRQEQ